MPLALNPNRKFAVVLESDKELPEKERPTFLFRYVTVFQWQDLADSINKIQPESMSEIQYADQVLNLLFGSLIGWENITDPETKKPIPFSRKNAKRILTFGEINELMNKMANQNMEIEDIKKSASPSASSMGRSAKNVKGRRRVKKKSTILKR